MRSLRSAATLLRDASTLDALAPVLATLGFPDPPRPLDPAAHHALGAPPLGEIRVARGPGALRTLLVAVDQTAPIRDTVARLATRLTRRTPDLLWLIAAVELGGPHIVLAACETGSATAPARGTRTAALVVDRDHVVDSDAETLCALEAATVPGDDLLTHARRLDILGRESLTRRFYRAVRHGVTTLATRAVGHAPHAARHEIALLHACRLLFLAFLEAKGWLDDDRAWLTHSFADCLGAQGEYHQRVLRPLFFGTLNTPPRQRARTARAFGRIPFLNGGLFAPTAIERRHTTLRFPDDALGVMLGEVLARYRFTAREDRASWSEAAIDPEMLGKAFENLMADDERRATGAYYTPQRLVSQTTNAAIAHALAGAHATPDDIAALLAADHAPTPTLDHAIRPRLAALRVLDPACGSGAFLVHALDTIATLHTRLGDPRDGGTIRRDVLTRSIFGVDINPTAVWLCELRLWLAVVIDTAIDDPMRVTPLPNLDRNIRVGDSLAPEHGDARIPAPRATTLERLRERYTRATGPRKHALRAQLDRQERGVAVDRARQALAATTARRADLIAACRGRDLFGMPAARGRDRMQLRELRRDARALRIRVRALADGAALPFAYATHFADVAADGGFDTVIGNPPWVRLHAIPREARARLRRHFQVYAHAAWDAGARRAQAGAGFAAQIDLAALFIERGIALCRPGGVIAMLAPAKLLRSLAGGGLRTLLLNETALIGVDDWSTARPTFDAAVYPALIVARRATPDGDLRPTDDVAVSVHRARTTHRWVTATDRLPLDRSPGSVWLLVPPAARAAFDILGAAGRPLADTHFGRPMMGVKSGYNEAFIVTVERCDGAIAHVRDAAIPPRTGTVERQLLRPLIRGESVARWTVPDTTPESVVWTHGPTGAPLSALPLHAGRWLAASRSRLDARRDAGHRTRWWALFRTESARSQTPRVVWADFGRTPRAAALPAGHPAVPLNSCYTIRCADLGDAHALTTLLNSPLAAAWLNTLAEPARGDYHRYLGWTVALLPIPSDWRRARRLLAPLGAAAADGTPPAPDRLWQTTLLAYGLEPDAVAPLVAWTLGPDAETERP